MGLILLLTVYAKDLGAFVASSMNLQETITKRILSNIYPEKIGEILKGIKVSYSSDTILKI